MVLRLRMLLWDVWLRNRLGILLVLTGLVLSIFLYPFLTPFMETWPRMRKLGFLPPGFSLLFMGVIFSHDDFHRKANIAGFPQRYFLLPASTSFLVLSFMFFGVFFPIVLYLLYTFLVLQPNGYEPAIFLPCLLIAACVLWMQVVNWAFARKPIQGVILLSLILPFVIGFGLYAWSGPGTIFGTAGLIAFGLVAAAFAVLTVSRARTGRSLMNGENLLGKLPGLPPPVASPFSSSQKAQFWFEWKQFGYMLPGLYLVTASIFLIIPILKPLSDQSFFILLAVHLLIFAYIGSFSGIEFSKSDFRSREREMTAFWAIRPMDDRALAASKLKLMAGTLAFTIMATMGSMVVFTLVCGKWEVLLNGWRMLVESFGTFAVAASIPLVFLILYVVVWAFSGNAMALGLTGSKKIINRAMVLSFTCSNSIVIGAVLLFRDQEMWLRVMAWIPVLIGIGSAILLLLFMVAIYHLRKKCLKIVGNPFLPASAIVLLLAVAGFALPLNLLERHDLWSLLCGAVNLVILAVSPLILAPLALHLNRHR